MGNPSRNLPTLPENLLSEEHQNDYLRKVSALEDPRDRVRALEQWTQSLATTDELRTALRTLLGAKGKERTALMNLFGPALLSQWGTIDPTGGIKEWSEVAYADQWRLNGSDPDLMHSFSLITSPIPESLLASWSSNDFQGFIDEFTDPESIFIHPDLHHTFLKDKVAKIFEVASAGQPVEYLISSVNTNASRIEESGGLHMAGLVPSLTNRLIEEQGGLLSALAAAESMPRTPVQESVVMDLKTSRLFKELGDQFEVAGFDSRPPDPEILAEIRTSFLDSAPLAQSQYFLTLKNEYRMENRPEDWKFSTNLKANAEWKAFQKELFQAYVDNGGFDLDGRGLIPSELRDLEW